MRSITDLFWELKIEILKIIMINALLDSFVVFLVSYIVLSFFGATLLYPITFSVGYFVFYCIKNLRKIQLRDIEREHPAVRDLLSTANDNIKESNIMVRALFKDLAVKMKNVSSSSFLSMKRIVNRLILISILCVVMVSLSSFTQVAQMRMSLNLPGFTRPDYRWRDSDAARLPTHLEGKLIDDDSIFGEAVELDLGSGVLEVELGAMYTEEELAKLEEEQSNSYRDDLALEVFAVADQFTDEDAGITREQQEIIKRYFSSIEG